MRARNLRALILAAGRGERMRPLTDRTPKPLLPVRGKPLIEWHIEALARAGVTEIVINTAWLEEQFPATLGHGERWGLTIEYSREGRDHGGALETAGGIAKALPLLGACFWVVSGDIFAPDFAFDAATASAFAQSSRDDSLLWLVPNPPFNPGGDFALDDAGRVHRPANAADRRWTYANLALMRDRQVAGVAIGVPAKLGPLLFASAAQERVAGRAWTGTWHNVGSAAQLDALDRSSA